VKTVEILRSLRERRGGMRKIVVPLLATVVVVAMILGGCAAPAAAPTTPPTAPSEELTFPWEGCFAKPDGTPYQVVFITDQAANLPMIMHTQHDQGIIERGGGEWTLFSADMDVAKQSSALEDQLVAKPDAIILHPVAADTTIPYVEQGTEAGINFYVSMMPPLTTTGELHPDIVGYIGDYQMSSGLARTAYMLDYFEAKGTKARVLFAWGTYGAGSFCEPVYEAFMDTIGDSPLVEVIYETPATDFSMERLYDAVVDAFTAHPDINAIIPCCGMGEQGITNALEDLGVWFVDSDPNHVFFATRDAEPWALDLVKEGYINCDGDMHIDRYSDTCAKAVWWYTVKGESIASVNTSEDWMNGQSPGGRRDILMRDDIVMPEDVDAMNAYWVALGDDYYNWPCKDDEKFIKYPTP
jgi:ABC-type sugar transport system substrate-binding protein